MGQAAIIVQANRYHGFSFGTRSLLQFLFFGFFFFFFFFPIAKESIFLGFMIA